MANLLDRSALRPILQAATASRRLGQPSAERTLTVYVAKGKAGTGWKPPFWLMKAHASVHAAAVEGFGGRVMQELPDGIVGVFSDPLTAVRAGLHALHAMDMARETAILPVSRVAVAAGPVTLIERPFRAIDGAGLDRALKLAAIAPNGHVIVERPLLGSPFVYGDIEVLQSKKSKVPGLGSVEAVSIRPLALDEGLDEELETVDAELRARPRR